MKKPDFKRTTKRPKPRMSATAINTARSSRDEEQPEVFLSKREMRAMARLLPEDFAKELDKIKARGT